MIDGDQKSFLGIIYALNEIAGAHGFGRIDMIENRLVGVKSRECYEAPAALALIQAHKALEDLVLEREVLHYKLGMEQAWATPCTTGSGSRRSRRPSTRSWLHAALPVRHGALKFYKGSCTVVGRKSAYSLYDYAWPPTMRTTRSTTRAAKGFIQLHTLSGKTWAANRRQEGRPGRAVRRREAGGSRSSGASTRT